MITAKPWAMVLCGLLGSACSQAERDPSAAAAAPTTSERSANSSRRAAKAPMLASATPAVSAIAKAPAAPAGMVAIPAGIFLMGSPTARGNPEEKPAHEAIVAAFFLDRTEVRHDRYMRCVAAGKCKEPRRDHRYCNVKLEAHDNHPANCIDLRQADAYCQWADKRLPTEPEWEYAASGGTERRRYAWGDAPPTPENNCYNHPGGTCPVGSFPAGAFGLHDMTGNVWEWTATRYRYYPSKAQADPIVPKRYYVYRGGSWSRRFPKWMHTRLRNRYHPDQFSAAIGARCARSIEPLRCPPQSEARDGVCLRTAGTVLCEPGYRYQKGACKLDAHAVTTPGQPQAPGLKPATSPIASTEAKPQFSRQRTPKHDSDCRKFWPNTPASYLFTGGEDFHSRKRLLNSAGCKPRDMGRHWTSACCAN